MRLELDEDVVDGLLRALLCDRREAVVLGAALMFPLSSTALLAVLTGEPEQRVEEILRDYRDRGVFRQYLLGSTANMAWLHWLTREGRAGLPAYRTAWHRDEAIAALLPRLHLAEWGYRAVAAETNLGPVKEFSWSAGTPWEGVAQYRRGWTVLLGLGILVREADIRRKFRSLGDALHERRDPRCDPIGAFPHRMVFLVSDEWQREMVTRVARDLRMEDCVQTMGIGDGRVEGATAPGPGYGRVIPQAPHGNLGGWLLEDRLAASRWSSPGGALASALMDCAVQWPGVSTSLAQAYVPRRQGEETVRRELADLAERHLLERHKRDGRTNGYAISALGYHQLTTRDRVRGGRVPGRYRYNAGANPPRLSRHQGGLMRMATECYGLGIPMVPGHRAMFDHEAPNIAPDAMVRLAPPDLPHGWYYLEYELSAQSPARIARKVGLFPEYNASGTLPVLVVAATDRAEATFQAQSRETARLILTTTVSRLNDKGFANCWSLYGTSVPLL